MVAVAVTGKRAPAAAWSDSPEERRKMLFSNFREGTPFLVFDNIPRGTGISCPHIDTMPDTGDHARSYFGTVDKS